MRLRDTLLVLILLLMGLPALARDFAIVRQGANTYLVHHGERRLLMVKTHQDDFTEVRLSNGDRVVMTVSPYAAETDHSLTIARKDGTTATISLTALRDAWVKEGKNPRGRWVLRGLQETLGTPASMVATITTPVVQGTSVLALLNWHNTGFSCSPMVAQFLVRITTAPPVITPLCAMPSMESYLPMNMLFQTQGGLRLVRRGYDNLWQVFAVSPAGVIGNREGPFTAPYQNPCDLADGRWLVVSDAQPTPPYTPKLVTYDFVTKKTVTRMLPAARQNCDLAAASPDSPYCLIAGSYTPPGVNNDTRPTYYAYLVNVLNGTVRRLPRDGDGFIWHGAVLQWNHPSYDRLSVYDIAARCHLYTLRVK
jgi:hypothetical protein